MRTRLVGLLAAVVVIGAVGIAIYHGAGPLPDRRDRCRTTVGAVTVDLDPAQARNATIIAAVGVRRGLPARAVSIALATAFQESKLRNLDHGDRDSLGLFQQRPSQGWGSARQVRDPYYATNAFYEVLAKIDGFETMRITDAAQKVQRSGYPEAYEPHAADARALASALTGYSPGGRFSCVTRPLTGKGTYAAAAASLRRGFGPLTMNRGARQDFDVVVGSGLVGQRKGWAVAQYLVAHASSLKLQTVSYAKKRWSAGDGSKDGWVKARTTPGSVSATLG